jgi:NAD-dependent dihydropyrimidine dehydrogenase PreA subunit
VTYVIAKQCIVVMDRAEGGRAPHTLPDECVDCGAREPVCAVEAICHEDGLPEALTPHLADNEAFFTHAML